jgi:hypothetical protein
VCASPGRRPDLEGLFLNQSLNLFSTNKNEVVTLDPKLPLHFYWWSILRIFIGYK